MLAAAAPSFAPLASYTAQHVGPVALEHYIIVLAFTHMRVIAMIPLAPTLTFAMQWPGEVYPCDSQIRTDRTICTGS